MKHLILIVLLILTGCGKVKYSSCSTQIQHTVDDYGAPAKLIQMSDKGDYVGGSVYYYPDIGFMKTFDSVVPEDDQAPTKCEQRYILLDAEKFVKNCKRYDCVGLVFNPA
jgi:hypothetical protein